MRPNNQRRRGRGGNGTPAGTNRDQGTDQQPKEGRNGSPRGRSGQPSSSQAQNAPPPVVARVVNAPDCVLCGKKIQDLSTAVVYGATKDPVHFECVVQDIEKNEQCTPMEKVIYIGGGQFAVVNGLAYRNNKIEIIRKIKTEAIEDRLKSVLGEIAVHVE